MWLVLLNSGKKMHSAHLTEAAALAWAKCKEHDGEDTRVMYLTAENVEMILELAAPKEGR